MRDDEWQQAFYAGRAEAEGLVKALEDIIATNQQREWTATHDNPETHWVVRDGPYARIARTALAKYREGR